MAQKKIVNGQF